MMVRLQFLLLAVISICVFSCGSQNGSVSEKEATADSLNKTFQVDTTWRYKYDFDGDKVPDVISYSYSGGAHCCYKLMVHLTSSRSDAEVPFLISGGYIVFDLSQQDNFNIVDTDHNGVYKMFINLDHYKQDRSEEELKKLQDQYKFNTSHVLISFQSGSIQVQDGDHRSK